MRLTPRAARDAIDGVEQAADGSSRLKVRVRAVPERGKANAALEEVLAKGLRIPASRVSVIAGGTSRLKTVHVAGSQETLADGMAALARET